MKKILLVLIAVGGAVLAKRKIDEGKKERRTERADIINNMKGLFPGKWRGRKAKNGKR